MSGTVKLIFLGGVCEVGKNCLVIETDDEIAVVDAGLAFPGTEFPGVDYIIPDFQYLRERRGKVKCVALTHGHEDHIGALPHLMEFLSAPVYGPALALGLIQLKGRDFASMRNVEYREITEGGRLKLDTMELEFLRVNHSIPGNLGFAVRACGSLVVHTGDYKMDETPVDGFPTDIGRFRELGGEGVDLMICDCTNVEAKETLSEAAVRDRFEKIFRDAGGKVIFSTFASNIHRIQIAFEMAEKFHRKVFVAGWSMSGVIDVAVKSGYLEFGEGIMRDAQEIERFDNPEILVMCTGVQGEPLSALRLISTGRHRHVRLDPEDTVIVSASAIPGNESFVNQVINNISRVGARVVYGDESGVHVSGHGGADEVMAVVRAVKPEYLTPFHGEYRHVKRMEELLDREGFPLSRYIVMERGTVVELCEGRLSVGQKVHAGSVFVDGGRAGDVGGSVIRERRQIGEEGVVVVAVGISRGTRELAGALAIESCGFSYPPVAADFFAELKDELHKHLRYEGSLPDENEEAKNYVIEFCGRRIQQWSGRNPVVLVAINEI